MRSRYDPEADALSVVLRETTVTTRELADGVVAEYDAEDRLVGLEIVDAASRVDDPSAFREIVLEGIRPVVSSPASTLGAAR